MTASPFRPLLAALVGVALLSSSGCVWLRTKFANTAVYEDSEQVDPLEVPPDLDVPDSSAGVAIPNVTPNPRTQGVAAGSAPPAAAPVPVPVPVTAVGADGFMLADTTESAFRRVGVALGKIDGVVPGESTQSPNTHTVTFLGTTMLIRVDAAGDGSRVSAAGLDGTPLTTAAAVQLLALIKARLG